MSKDKKDMCLLAKIILVDGSVYYRKFVGYESIVGGMKTANVNYLEWRRDSDPWYMIDRDTVVPREQIKRIDVSYYYKDEDKPEYDSVFGVPYCAGPQRSEIK